MKPGDRVALKRLPDGVRGTVLAISRRSGSTLVDVDWDTGAKKGIAGDGRRRVRYYHGPEDLVVVPS